MPNDKTKLSANQVHLLMKTGEEQYMKKLFEEGEIFMQLSSRFRKDGNGERGDELEGVMNQKPIDCQKISMALIADGERIPITPISGWKRIYTANFPYIYCLWCLDTRTAERQSKNFTVIKDLADFKKFGDTCVTIINPIEFIKRIKTKLTEMGIQYHCEPVEYIDFTTHDGGVTPFMKDVRFAHQQEFRFAITGGTKPDFSFKIGSLNDIALLTNLNYACRMEFYGETIEYE